MKVPESVDASTHRDSCIEAGHDIHEADLDTDLRTKLFGGVVVPHLLDSNVLQWLRR